MPNTQKETVLQVSLLQLHEESDTVCDRLIVLLSVRVRKQSGGVVGGSSREARHGRFGGDNQMTALGPPPQTAKHMLGVGGRSP